ncbi:MAG: hypothetical protein ACO3QC_10695 [Phycisphaerales bacterium]
MHALTKIFVVLVALLTVALVPLVAVNATNESTFQSKFKGAQLETQAARDALGQERSASQASIQKLESELQAANARAADLEKQVAAKASEARKAAQELAGAKEAAASNAASLATLAEATKANNQLADSLVAELRALRTKAMDAETRLAQLQDAFDASQSSLEVADAARRALQEEVQRLSDEKDRAVATIAEYVARVGEIATARAGAVSDSARVPADRDLTATVINVRRDGGGVLAEINAGARDGVKKGWVMIIGDGSTFIGNLRVTEVDVNRAVGIVELEDPSGRGEAKAGQRAVARSGE